MAALAEGYYTIQDVYDLPDGERAELVNGHLYMMAPPLPYHERICHQLGVELELHIREKKLPCEVLTSNVGIYLFGDDSTYLLPDLKVVCDPSKMYGLGYHGAPDFVVEVASKSTKGYDKVQKSKWYMDAGVKEYWIIDPDKRTVETMVFQPEFNDSLYTFDHDIPVSICPGFCINLSKLGL